MNFTFYGNIPEVTKKWDKKSISTNTHGTPILNGSATEEEKLFEQLWTQFVAFSTSMGLPIPPKPPLPALPV